MTAGQKRQVGTRAGRGALLLDQFVPNWTKKVDKSAIQMDNGAQCLLGQSFGDFGIGSCELAEMAIKKTLAGTGLKLEEGALTDVRIDSVHYGFDEGGANDSLEEYSVLGEAWLGEIAAREATAKRSRAARKGVATRRANSRTRR